MNRYIHRTNENRVHKDFLNNIILDLNFSINTFQDDTPYSVDSLIQLFFDYDNEYGVAYRLCINQPYDTNDEKNVENIINNYVQTQISIITIMGTLYDNRISDFLIDEFQNFVIDARLLAIDILSQYHTHEVTNFFIVLLRDKDKTIRLNAAKSLEKLGWSSDSETDIVNYLIAKEEWDQVVKFNPQSLEALINALEDPDQSIQEASIEALVKIGEPIIPKLIEKFYENNCSVSYPVSTVLGRIGDPAFEQLVLLLQDENWTVRRKVIQAFRSLNPSHSFMYLMDSLKDEDSIVRNEAACALGNIGGPEVSEMLIEGLMDKDKRISIGTVLEDVALFRNQDNIETFIQLLRNEDWEIRKNAAEILGKIGNQCAIKPLLDVLHDENFEVRMSVIESLGLIGDPLSVESLICILKDDEDEEIIMLSAWSLGEIGDERSIPYLIKAYDNDYFGIKREIYDALKKMGVTI